MNVKRCYFPIVLINGLELASFNEQIDMEESRLFDEVECQEDEMNASCVCYSGCGSNDYSRGDCICLGSCGSNYSNYPDGHCWCFQSCGSNSNRE